MKIESEFPFDKLPELGAFPLPVFQAAINELVRANKVPPKLACYCTVALAGTLGQIHVNVEKPKGGFVGTGVYVLMQGTSGQRKTKVDERLFRELRKISVTLRNRRVQDLEVHGVRFKIWKHKNKVLMRALEKAYGNGEETDDIEAAICTNEKAKPEAPTEIKVVFNDVTMAKLKSKLSQSPNAALLSSDGKKVLGDLLQNDADANKLWSNEEIDVERVTSASYTLHDVRTSFSIMIQPEPLARIMQGKGKEGKESGFFARVIFSDVGSTAGQRLIDLLETTTANLGELDRRVSTLMAEYIEAVASGSYKRRLLKFDPEASRVWISYFNYVESNINVGGRYEKAGDHASKLADNVARVAADLHVLEGFVGDIGMNCLLCAIVLCDEASKDYMMHLGPKDEDEIEAIELKHWLVEKFVHRRTTWIDLNHVLQTAPNRMRSARKIHRYLEILERAGYLAVWPSGRQGRTKVQIELRMTRDGQARSTARPIYGVWPGQAACR